MQPTTLDPLSTASHTAAPNAAALRAHVRGALNAPLAAVRAALEVDRSRSAAADRALAELVRVERAVRDIVSYCTEAPRRSTRTTLGEIAQCLRARLETDERQRLWVSVEEEAAEVRLDGAVLVDVLERLARQSLEDAGAEALFHAHADEHSVTFSIVDDPGRDVDPVVDAPEPATDLALELARRFAERSGGLCNVHRTSPEHRCVILKLPRQEAKS